jgi:hypothetical protein
MGGVLAQAAELGSGQGGQIMSKTPQHGPKINLGNVCMNQILVSHSHAWCFSRFTPA